MEPSEYANIARHEGQHWWYVGMRRLSLALLEQAYGDRDDLRVLDAGCGVGGMAAALGRFGLVVGVDYSPLAMHYARRNHPIALGQANVLSLPFPDATFDLVTSFDVLYHRSVSDANQALREAQRVLRPGGRLLVRVPAYDWLRGRHDTLVHTERRFTARRLGQLLRAHGFTIERLSYANMLLLAPAVVQRASERALGAGSEARSDIAELPDPLNRLLTGVLAAEARRLRRGNLPAGLSVMALARKP